jgi:aminoglycoside 2'-N-acetyltransferase I
MMSEKIQIISVAETKPALDKELRDWFRDQFAHTTYRWAEPDYYGILSVEEQLAGRLAIFHREVSAGGVIVKVGGIGGVATKPKWRRREVASALLSRAAEFMRNELSAEFGFLLCGREVSPVYAKLGWTRVEGPTIFSQPGGTETYPHDTMILLLAGREWPPGPIDMMGLPL